MHPYRAFRRRQQQKGQRPAQGPGSLPARPGCDDLIEASDPGRFARRPLLRAAVLGEPGARQAHDAAYESLLRPPPVPQRTVVVGRVSDVSPHVLILRTREGEERLALTPRTTAWRGGAVAPTGLRRGDWVIARKSSAGARRRSVVEALWAQIGRATGTIVEASGAGSGLQLLVDEGPAKGRKQVLIAREAYRQVLVRFRRLEPGYLIDVIGLRQRGFLQAVTPATTSLPTYHPSHVPAPPLVSGKIPDPVSGTAVWHEPGEEPDTLAGLAYPALDPETECAPSAAPGDPHAAGPGCVRLPYLSIGSVVTVRNDCRGVAAPLPVTSCGAVSRLFCDRCVECGTSPRGRVADLTMAAFVQLGGLLENGCFNATISMSR